MTDTQFLDECVRLGEQIGFPKWEVPDSMKRYEIRAILAGGRLRFWKHWEMGAGEYHGDIDVTEHETACLWRDFLRKELTENGCTIHSSRFRTKIEWQDTDSIEERLAFGPTDNAALIAAAKKMFVRKEQ